MVRISSTLYYFFVSFTLLTACKSSKMPTSSSKNITDSITTKHVVLEQDTAVAKVDSLIIEIQDSVEISVHRLIKDTLTIIGVGDIMMGTNFPSENYLPPNKGKGLLSDVDSILLDADVTFGNLEGVILDDGGNAKYCKNPKICYIFRSPEYMVQNLVDAGFDVMSTANNHAGDFGNPGRKNTMRVLDSLGISHAGLQVKPFDMFMVDGMKYGFAAFAPNTGTMSINDIEKAKEIVAHLDSLNDVVIVSFHGGAEGSKYQRVTRKNEYFYGENRGNVYKFAH
ncbi:MAG: CapA family protein, partial [Bacteroidota bacterium]